MHKSGTTLLAEMLHKTGVDMGCYDLDKDYDDGNKMERPEAKDINKSLLNCGDTKSLYVTSELTDSKVILQHTEKAKIMIDNITRRNNEWGFKDPRTSLTYKFWKYVIPNSRNIIIFRDYKEVITHYASKINKYRPIKKLFYSLLALNAWWKYNNINLRIAKENNDSIIISYKLLMESEVELKRLSKYVGREIYDARKPNKYRSKINNIYSKIVSFIYYLITLNDVEFLAEELDFFRCYKSAEPAMLQEKNENNIFCN